MWLPDLETRVVHPEKSRSSPFRRKVSAHLAGSLFRAGRGHGECLSISSLPIQKKDFESYTCTIKMRMLKSTRKIKYGWPGLVLK